MSGKKSILHSLQRKRANAKARGRLKAAQGKAPELVKMLLDQFKEADC